MKEALMEDAIVDTYQVIEPRVLNALDDIVSFSGIPQNYAIGFVDIVNSSNITAKMTFRKASMYYSTFLNSMSVVVNASGGKVVKNIGDSLMFYFKEDDDFSHRGNFSKILDCGINMIHARRAINEKLMLYDLPELNYRISADYGCILVADSKTSFNKDLFGSPVNTCSRINHLANPNTLVIGYNLYKKVRSARRFEIKKIETCVLLGNKRYNVYGVKRHTTNQKAS